MDNVSVVIPTFNRRHTLEACIGSVQQQTYRDIEIIVVDDGSDDGTKELVQKLILIDARIKLISYEKNLGAQAARNIGIKHADGKWIAFLDSDDRYLPDSIELRLDYLQENGLKIVYTGCYIINEDGNRVKFNIPAMSGYVYRDVLVKPGPMFQSLLVSKDAIERIDYLDESIVAYQEWDTSIRLAKDYEFGYLDTPTFVYDCRERKTISRDLEKDLAGYKQIIRKHLKEIILKTGLSCTGRHLYSIAIRSKKNGRSISGLFYLLLSKLLDPGQILRSS